MSLLSWLTRKPSLEDSAPASAPTGGDSTRPASLADARGSSRSERNARRAQLFGVVRECMVNAGVLSTSYKFKVLSLDSRGRQFLVMVDLGGAQDGRTSELGEIETAISQAAKARHGIVVKAVYWRSSEPVAAGAQSRAAAGAPAPRTPTASMPAASASTAAAGPVASPAPAAAAMEAASAEPRNPDEPMAQEIAAFKQAVAEGAPRPAVRAFDGSSVQGPQSYTLLTGFEDTEIRDSRLPSSAPGSS